MTVLPAQHAREEFELHRHQIVCLLTDLKTSFDAVAAISGRPQELADAEAASGLREEVERLKRELRLWKDANHEANELAGYRRVQRDELTRRTRKLEDALRELYEASRAYGSGKYKRLIAAEKHACAILGDDK